MIRRWPKIGSDGGLGKYSRLEERLRRSHEPMVLHGQLYVTEFGVFGHSLTNEISLEWGKMVAQLSNNDGFRLQRKFVHQCLNAQAVASVRSLHTEQTHILLKNILDNPKDFRRHLER